MYMIAGVLLIVALILYYMGHTSMALIALIAAAGAFAYCYFNKPKGRTSTNNMEQTYM